MQRGQRAKNEARFFRVFTLSYLFAAPYQIQSLSCPLFSHTRTALSRMGSEWRMAMAPASRRRCGTGWNPLCCYHPGSKHRQRGAQERGDLRSRVVSPPVACAPSVPEMLALASSVLLASSSALIAPHATPLRSLPSPSRLRTSPSRMGPPPGFETPPPPKDGDYVDIFCRGINGPQSVV